MLKFSWYSNPGKLKHIYSFSSQYVKTCSELRFTSCLLFPYPIFHLYMLSLSAFPLYHLPVCNHFVDLDVCESIHSSMCKKMIGEQRMKICLDTSHEPLKVSEGKRKRLNLRRQDGRWGIQKEEKRVGGSRIGHNCWAGTLTPSSCSTACTVSATFTFKESVCLALHVALLFVILTDLL